MPAPARLGYIVEGETYDGPPLVCSMCGEESVCLAKLPIGNYLRGWRRVLAMTAIAEPWFGLCETCVHRIWDDFPRELYPPNPRSSENS